MSGHWRQPKLGLLPVAPHVDVAHCNQNCRRSGDRFDTVDGGAPRRKGEGTWRNPLEPGDTTAPRILRAHGFSWAWIPADVDGRRMVI